MLSQLDDDEKGVAITDTLGGVVTLPCSVPAIIQSDLKQSMESMMKFLGRPPCEVLRLLPEKSNPSSKLFFMVSRQFLLPEA